MPITLTAVESFPVYESDGTSHDEDFGTVQFVSASGQILGQLRVLMSDLDLGGLTTEQMAAAVDAAGAQLVAIAITASDYISLLVAELEAVGQTVNLVSHSRIGVGLASLVLSGQSVQLTADVLTVGVAAVVLTGQNVNLT